MEKAFKKLLGFRVYLLAPNIKSDNVYLSDKAKKEVAKSRMQDFMRLKVYAIGEAVTGVNEGDEVLVGDVALSNAPIIDLEEGVSVILVSFHDIVHIW